MSSLQLNSSSYPSNTFGLLSAATSFIQGFPTANDTSGILYDQGCKVDETRNCTLACQDPTQVFKSPYTLQNCMVLSALAPSNWVPLNDTTNVNWTQPLSADAVRLAIEFGINTTSSDFPSIASNVTKTIKECFEEYNAISANAQQYDYVFFGPWYGWGGIEEINLTGAPVYNISCPLEVPVNEDIGGIGVYISYWMQTAIALSGFLLLQLCDDQFYRWSIFLYFLFWPFGFRWPIGLRVVKRKASILQAHLCRYSPAIKSSLVEFHKAQCFFIIALEIAANITVRQGTLNDGITTLQGLFNNYTLVGSISISGFLPVTFTLLALHRAGMHSYYLLILSHCALVLSAITMFRLGDFVVTGADMINLANTSFKSSKCGNLDPTTFCLDTLAGYGQTEYFTSMKFGYGAVGGPALVFTCIILALIDLDYLGLQRTSKYKVFVRWGSSWLEGLLRSKNKPKSANSTQKSLAIFKDCFYLCIWVWYITFITISLQGLYSPANGATLTSVRSWTVGQIVAVTVWAGPLFEFVKLSVQGLKKGLNYRTPHPFTITEPDDAAEEEEFRVWFKWSRPVVKEEPVFKIF